MEILLFVAFVTIAIGAAYFSYQARLRRMADLRAFAASMGWQYSQHDTFGLPHRFQGPPFDEGYARTATNVMLGQVRGLPLVAFDYSYKEDSTDSDGSSRTTTYRFSIVALRMPCPLPEIRVSPEGVLSRIGGMLGFSDIELESEDFNRRYRLSSPYPKFATDVMTPRTMQLLLRDEPIQFRFFGPDAICWHSGKAKPSQILVRAEMLAGVVEGIPAFVWKDFGHDPHAQPAG